MNPRSIPAGVAVPERQLDLLQIEPRAHGVDRHSRLDAEPGCDGKAHRPRALREPPLARQRLACHEARPGRDQRPCRPLCDPEAAALAAGEDGDREVRRRTRSAGGDHRRGRRRRAGAARVAAPARQASALDPYRVATAVRRRLRRPRRPRRWHRASRRRPRRSRRRGTRRAAGAPPCRSSPPRPSPRRGRRAAPSSSGRLQRQRRKHAVGRRLLDAVVTACRAGEKEHECQPPGSRVDAVHSREAVAREGRDGTVLRRGRAGHRRREARFARRRGRDRRGSPSSGRAAARRRAPPRPRPQAPPTILPAPRG